jgi:nicotinate-nucleotide adenylyltransferase
LGGGEGGVKVRFGLLGGSFNPVHCGHVRMALEAREALGLDRVELVCAPSPPHKPRQGLAPFSDRFALLQSALSEIPGLKASDVEAGREGPSYTIDTLEEYKSRIPGVELHFILGLPSLYDLDHWHEGLRLPEKASLAACPRTGADPARLPAYVAERWPRARPVESGVWEFPSGTRLRLLDAPALDISGTDARRRWMDGRSLRCLVPDAVVAGLEARREVFEEAWRGGSG